MKKNLIQQIIIATLFKLLLNIGRRFMYPFAPALSRGLDVPLTAITTLIATGQISSLLGLFCGPFADRFGYRAMMQAGLGLLMAGMLICGVFPFYEAVFIGLVMASFGKVIFDPALQAYLGTQVKFSNRARAIGITETSWAGSTLIGIPLLGLVIEYGGLTSSFYLLAILGALSFFSIKSIFPEDSSAVKVKRERGQMFSSLLEIVRLRPVLGMLSFGFWISIANDNLFVVYGVWLEHDFNVTLISLGFSTVAIGAAELIGESCTATFADRLGLKKSIITGLVLAISAYILLPFISTSLVPAMVGMFLVFCFFEFTIVTSFSLCTELVPAARATMMASFYATSGVGRMLGVLLGGYLWKFGGIEGVAFSSALFTGIGLISLLVGLKGWRPE